MKKSRSSMSRDSRRQQARRNFLRVERLEERVVFSVAAPVAVNDLYEAPADQTLEISGPAILANDTLGAGEALSAQLFSGPSHGKLALNDDGSFAYTPDSGFTGLDSFMYTASDGVGSSNLAAVTLMVGEAAPVAENDVFTVDEDNPLAVAGPGVLGNDSDADGQALTASLVNGPLHGSLTFEADGSFVYQPDADFNGIDGFSYAISDGSHNSQVASVTIQVNSVNDAPVAGNDEYVTDEDTALVIAAPGILANDTDADGDVLTPSIVQGPTNGTVEINDDGSFTYTPNADFNGTDGFSYSVNDGTTDSDPAAVTITVNAVNDAPLAVADEYVTDEDTALVIAAPGILGNDTDADGDVLMPSIIEGPANGTLVVNSDGSFTYTPNADFNGTDGFSYLVNDGTVDSEATTVSIVVNAVNDSPVAGNEEYTTAEDTPLVIAPPGVLENDSDPDADPLTPTIVQGPTNGTLALNADGSFTYTPNADFNGTDGFSYTVSDGTAESDVAAVTINVTPVNDVPVATADEYATDEDTALVIDAPGILGNDSDVDGDALTPAIVAGPASGTLVVNSDGSFTYTPNADFNGADGFSYYVTDGVASSDTVSVTITVNPVNDAPVATADEYATDEDTALVIAAPGILANDTDADGDVLTPTVVAGPTNGTLVVNSDGSFDYTPNADFNGADSFTYSVNDGTTESAVVTVGIAVNAANDAPVAGDDEFVTDEDTPLVIAAPGVLANDSDVDGDPLSAAVVTGPANGVLALNADGSFSYTPNANYNGIDSFTYSVSDGTTTTEATAYITVNAVPDVPAPRADAYNTGEDLPLAVLPGNGVLANDTNTEGTLAAVLASGPAHGTLTLNADGSFNYTPEANYFGPDSFTYVANNGAESSPETTVSILVQSINDAPVAGDDAYAATAGIVLEASGPTAVTANDVDVEGDALAASLISGPAHGTLVFNADGSFTYTPDEGYTGSDSFQYQLNDGISDSNVATVAIEVAPAGGNVQLDERPTSANDHYTATADQPLVVDPATGVLQNDADPEGAALVAILFTNPTNGTVTLAGDGSFVYTPNAGFVGQDSFMYGNSDGTKNSPLAAVTIDVVAATGSIVAPPVDETVPPVDETTPPVEDTPPTDSTDISCTGEHQGNVFSMRARDLFVRYWQGVSSSDHAASVDALLSGSSWWR